MFTTRKTTRRFLGLRSTRESRIASHGYVAALVVALLCGAASAQTYPSRPIRVVVPFTPGTGMDIIARNVGPKLSDRLGQPVVIDNRPGASGNLGAELVAKAAPDGYTLMISANPLVVAPHLYRNVPYKPLSDFAPISLAAWGTLLLAAYPGTKINTVADLIAQAKANPGKITYASPGVGTPHHMSMELLKDLTGTNLLHVPYKGSAGAVTDTLGGQVNVMFIPIHIAMPFVKSGRLKALAVGSPKRHPTAPDLPTLTEVGVKGADIDMWYGYFGPKSTSAAAVTKLSNELRTILALPEIKTALSSVGMDAASSTPAEFGALMKREDARWAAVIKKNNITAE
ncbi:MAG: Bug family tripartite tricarboxylate transporter substrate binding protein [Burkholderiales bacterium]